MTFPEDAICLGWLLVLVTGVTRPAGAQRGVVWQGQVVTTTAADPFVGGGLGWGLRGSGRLGLNLTASSGVSGTAFAGRFEGLATFHLEPGRRSGIGVYGAAGVAAVATKESTAEWLVFVIGLEARPRAKNGWFLELGLGGGVRAATGFRIRRFARR